MALAIGIDFGYKNCKMAAIKHDDIKIIQNSEGEDLTPAVVSMYRGKIIVGRMAVDSAELVPKDTIFSIKRLIGRSYSDPEVQKVREKVLYEIIPASDDNEGVRAVLGGKEYSPIGISSLILKKLKEDAEMRLNYKVSYAVITVPAWFTEKQRDAIRQAGWKAGLKVQRIVDEPTAAAIAYGVDELSPDETKTILIYDLGGRTFDVSVLLIAGGTFAQLDIEGDRWLGGDNFDQKIMDYVLQHIQDEYGVDRRGNLRFMIKLKKECEKAKKQISSMSKTVIFLPGILEDKEGNFIDIDVEITRERFERMIENEVKSTIDLVHMAIKNAKLTTDQIDNVLLVGGSTMIPMVHRALMDVFGEDKILRTIDSMKCVAQGAGIFAARYHFVICPECKTENPENASVCSNCGLNFYEIVGRTDARVTVKPHGIKAPGAGDKFEILIPKGTPYPTEPVTRTFYTSAPHKRKLKIPIYCGFDEVASKNELIGTIWVALPIDVSGGTPVDVTFALDEIGKLKKAVVKLKDGSDRRAEVEIDRGSDWTTEVNRILLHVEEELETKRKRGEVSTETVEKIMEKIDEVMGVINKGDKERALKEAEEIKKEVEKIRVVTSLSILQLITCLMKEERYSEAENIIKGYIDKDKESALRYYLGLVYTHQKRIGDALDEFKAVLTQNSESDGAKTLAIKLLLHQANRKIEEKDWDGACSNLSLALELKPNDIKIQQELIQFKSVLPITYLKTNRRNKAAEIWEEEQKNNPRNYRITHSLALLYYWWVKNEENENGTKKDTEFLDSLWLKVIANWVMLKYGKDFWKAWKEERERLCSKEGDMLQIEDDDIEELRDGLPELLDKEFYDYADHYRQEGMETDAERHERYQTALALELKSASYYKEVTEIINDRIDESIPPIRGIVWNALKASEDRINEHTTPICGVTMCKHLGILTEVERLVERAGKAYPENEMVERLKVYLSPLGPIQIFIEKKNLKAAIHEIETLPKTIRSSKEGMKVHATTYLELGKEILTLNDDINKALDCWKKGLIYATDPSIANLFNKTVSDACTEQAKRLNNQKKFDEALILLERGERLVTDESARKSLREYLAISYCDRGEKYLREDNLYKAENDLEKALEYNRNYRRAKDDLSVVYNNEGVKEKNLDRAIEKLEKAYMLNSTDAVRKNLAGAYAAKGVEAANREDLDMAIEKLEKAYKLNPAEDAIRRSLAGVYNAKAVKVAYWDRYLAANYIKRALELDPYNDTFKKNLDAVSGYGGF